MGSFSKELQVYYHRACGTVFAFNESETIEDDSIFTEVYCPKCGVGTAYSNDLTFIDRDGILAYQNNEELPLPDALPIENTRNKHLKEELNKRTIEALGGADSV